MYTWVISVCSVAIISALISLILPDGKIGVFAKSVFAMIIVMVVFKPLISLKETGSFNSIINNNTEIILQEDFLHKANKLRIKEMEKNCLIILKKCGIEKGDVVISYIEDENYGLNISGTKVYAYNIATTDKNVLSNLVHNVKLEISKYLLINYEQVEFYEK